ncbi:uncharacterized protein LOC144605496 [Rhinoraja longicauda]
MGDRRDQTAIIKEHQQEQNPRGSLETDCGSSGPILEDEAILKVAQCLRKLGEEYSDIAQQEMKTFQPRFHELLNDQELPELVPSVKTAMADCLNRNLLNWIRHSGGWENLL